MMLLRNVGNHPEDQTSQARKSLFCPKILSFYLRMVTPCKLSTGHKMFSQKLVVTEVIKKSPAFKGPDVSLP